jgi:hypothetical protein
MRLATERFRDLLRARFILPASGALACFATNPLVAGLHLLAFGPVPASFGK